jgi:4-oxalocrotonate tautomerase
MPILNVKVSAKRSSEMTQQISSMLSDLTKRILGKDPNLISIAIDYIDPEDWVVGGKSLAEQGKNSVYFDIKITDETNIKAEKETYIRETFAAFEQLLGNLHEVSYMYVQDVRAVAYGYGGKSQEFRFQHR